jgi:tetratricopeptide (TPR) repeat protein
LPQKGSAGRDEADALMERLVQDKPNDPNALMAASQYYFQTSRRDQAVSYAEKIIAAKPDMANGYLFLSLKYLESNDLDKAAKVLEDYLAKNAKGGSLVDVKCQLADILVLRSAYGGTTSAEAPPAAVEDLTRAKKLLNDVLQTNPGLLPAMTVLAKVFFQQANEASQQNQAAEKLQDIAQAEALLGQVVAQSPHFGEGYLLLAQCALLRGDSTKALEQLLKVQPNDSIYPRVLKLRAGIDRTRGEVEKFRTDLRQTLDLQPRDVEARVQLAELDASIHKYADAARTIQEGLQYQPDNPMLLISMAELSLSQNKLNEAQTLADKAVKILPDDPTVWGVWTKIMSAPGRGQAQEATAKLRTLVRTHLDAKASKQWLNFYLLLVRQLNSQGQWDESKPILQSLLKDHPEVPALYVVYANTLLAESGARTKGWPDKAVMNESIKVLTEAMASEKVGRKSELLRALYAIYQMQGDWVKADEVATELLKLNRDDAGAMVLHSEGLLNLKQYDDALTWAEKAVAADGLRYEAMNNIAWILSTQKSNKLDEARSWITRALKISPENPSLLDTSGWIQCLGKDYGAAILTLEHGLRGGDSAITRYHLGMAYKLKATQVTSPVLKKEAYQKADEHLKKALEMAPGDPSSADYQADAQKALAEVQKGLK